MLNEWPITVYPYQEVQSARRELYLAWQLQAHHPTETSYG